MTAGDMAARPAPQRLSVSVLLHLLPGVLALLVYLALVPVGARLGFPAPIVLLAAILAVLPAVELGHLLTAARRRAGSWSLRSIIDFPPRLRAWRYGVIVVSVVIAGIALNVLSAPADAWFRQRFLAWLPAWFDYSDLGQYRRFGRPLIVIYLGLRFVIDVLFLSSIEELYFRGYLLPRIPGPAWSAPILSVALFAVYHFWQPYNWPSIFCLVLPMCIAVWRFRDVRIGVYAHVTLNLIGFISTAFALARL